MVHLNLHAVIRGQNRLKILRRVLYGKKMVGIDVPSVFK